MRTTAILAVVVAVVVGGCGSGDPDVSAAAQARLGPQVEAIRQASTAGDRAGAELRLAELRGAVAELRAAGDLGSAAASRVLDRAAAVKSSLALLPTTTTQAPPSPEPERDDESKRDGDKEDKEKDEEDEDKEDDD